jgi:hypothetical protein
MPVAGARCDYCGGSLDLRNSVQYDVLRVVDSPALDRLFDVPDAWGPDAARCPSCERDAVAPATEGFNEALVTVSIVESTGDLRIDASSLTVDDASLADDGYSPPAIKPQLIAAHGDLGIARWLRLAWFFESETVPDEAVSQLRPIVEASDEVPPGIE